MIQKYQAQGIEFAVHGYRHVDYSQLSLDEQLEHFQAAQAIFAQEKIRFQGFRCPYLRANEQTITGLSQTDFAYDSTPSLYWPIVEADQITESYERALAFYGAKPVETYLSVPAIDFERNLVQIPYSLPDDESLIERINWRSEAEMNQAWVKIFEHTYQHGELFNLGLHPERTAACATALSKAMSAGHQHQEAVWRATLDEIARWWRQRYEAKVELTKLDEGGYHLTVSGPEGTRILLKNLNADVPLSPWYDQPYAMSQEISLRVKTVQKPIVGLSPKASPALAQFLRQQGYICETSTQANDYSLYLTQTDFPAEAQRAVIAQLEDPALPLLRLSRWPDGAKSALCVTGDIDCLTLWDYVLRFVGQ